MRKLSDIVPLKFENGKVVWLNTSAIPWKEEYKESSNYEDIARAIETMEVRGAPAIGVMAALGIAAAVYNSQGDVQTLYQVLNRAAERLSRTRPTAYNLFWAIDRMRAKANSLISDNVSPEEFKERIVEEALRIQREDIEINRRMGEIGSQVIKDGDVILTHCNTGSLATAGFGTALGVIRTAWLQGKSIRVIATETRPLLQGARLTMWELTKDGIPSKLITDNMVAYAMRYEGVTKVILGADRILVSGHVANKIGTYGISILAKYHGVDFYVVAPTSTIDRTGANEIVIERRKPDEVRTVLNMVDITVKDAEVLNPAFDVTPPELITGIITEKGIAYPPFKDSLKKFIE
ncbi:MAG: S-methyl-5-thioribose-1-phosphate isomerase [Metallosphaera sp.]|uniref:Putative methylthioribose-1-phosphate isomerase n=2 Tax=Metallosphaera sedula TaxID=43687 RepID=A4YJ05_METS5|nr:MULTISPECIES: S-methyl-5-thioribose-1-phosphate isomerase [Metallosphaera]ABP96407.1 translation initiation factor 2B subunit I family (IF-2BI) [Metallosphaera sedula DSM 5348]AIM28390.1 translation initiation factor 2B subunit I family (IF-2BI) [Metallosphaera sedula]AKV75179.1 methylthioribose-1-phosphate isomerase [Metallosphaera sedula]AKV77415.1 methylthioribose-1-phosphate isomerase [Metallosphaera sedula]AKV79667.1 methylthioribose-1-phosphate isomerase [Metallosphaera sedula]